MDRTRINTSMFQRRHRSQSLLAVSFAALLLFAQWLSVEHGANLEQHASSDACEWCLAHAPLHAALAASTINVLPLPAPLSQTLLPIVFLAGEPLPAYVTRAPPQSFSV